MTSNHLPQITKIMRQGDQKEALILLRRLLSENKFSSIDEMNVYKGWLASLERKEENSVFYSFFKDPSDEQIDAIIKEFVHIYDMITRQDPTKTQAKAVYFKTWSDLMKQYRKTSKGLP